MIYLFLIFSDWALLILRVIIGIIFIVHGLPKIKNLKINAQNFEMMGFKPGIFWGTIVAIIEPIAGTLILLGLFTQIGAILITINMIVAAIWKIKKGQGFIGGYEFDLLLAVAGLMLITLGGGVYSLDNFLRIAIY